jgi:putative transposase
MPKTTASLPNCRILDRVTLKWQRKTYSLVGVMDLASRKLLRWGLFRTLEPKAVASLLDQTIEKYGKPPALVVGIDAVFRMAELYSIYEKHDCTPVDLRQGQSSVTIFIRSLWRNLIGEGLSWAKPQTEEAFRQTIDEWLTYYNSKRLHQALGYQTPDERWHNPVAEVQAAEPPLQDESLTHEKILQLKITLLGIAPPIWRRLLVRESSTFGQLHDTLQVVMGWTNSHLHEFRVNGEGITPFFEGIDLEYGENLLDETVVTLKEKLAVTDVDFRYLYDFGDGWEHSIAIEQWLPAEPGIRYPVCLDGARNCPPEDCGGVWGYADLLTILNDKAHPERAEMLSWLGGRFNPESFNLEKINRQLAKLSRS